MSYVTGRLLIWPRGGLTGFISRHEFAWDVVMGVLTVAYVVLAFTESPSGIQLYSVWALAVVFLAEFSFRCYDSLSRTSYLRSHWLDLVTAVPIPGIPGLRVLRLLRLLRFAKVGILVREALVSRGWGETGLIWPTLVLFWVVSALALWLVEHDAPGSNITTFADAMTAAFLTAATLGFGRHGLPVTQDGQIVAAVIVFFALGLWGFASSNLTRIWLRAGNEVQSAQLDGVRRELHLIREQLDHLSGAMIHRHDTANEPSHASHGGGDSRELAAVDGGPRRGE